MINVRGSRDLAQSHCVRLGPLSGQFCAQVLRIMFKLSLRDTCLIPVSDARVVTEEVNAAALNVFWEEYLWPKNTIFGPGTLSRSTETMYENNTERMQPLIGFSGATHVSRYLLHSGVLSAVNLSETI